MDFKTGKELVELCSRENISISSAMKKRELANGGTEQEIAEKMERALSIMKNAVKEPLSDPRKSLSGLIGGEAKKVWDFQEKAAPVWDSLVGRVICYSMAVLEVNASMGVIVAAPTAGSSGVLPGVLLALREEKKLTDEDVIRGMFHAGAIGYLLMKNASVSGAEAGCQAETGSASAMAAGAVVELMGGSPGMCLAAASMALSNMLGLVCDPVAGLVEVPCQGRNVLGALNALACGQIILSGVDFPIPFDEMASAMYRAGRNLPAEFRETAVGGCAGTPTGNALKCTLCK